MEITRLVATPLDLPAPPRGRGPRARQAHPVHRLQRRARAACATACEVGCLRERLGIPSGERHELCRALHAEQNAIIQAALHGVSVDGATLYCTAQPCVICAKMLINSGIR